jgi:hypothetical protein
MQLEGNEVIGRRKRREENDGDPTGKRIGADASRKLDPVELGHGPVGEDHRWRRRSRRPPQRQCSTAVLGRHSSKPDDLRRTVSTSRKSGSSPATNTAVTESHHHRYALSATRSRDSANEGLARTRGI